MSELNNDWNKAYKKSARVVGDVIGKYHPHGDSAVYDTIVRMAQPFSLRYPLVDGQGNFGSIDGDAPAAMRYTEIRMAKIAHDILADLDKETVDFVENYDGSEQLPEVLPTRVPNLLINGSSGIAVGMATNIPPHNLGEVINACLALIDQPDIPLEGLMEQIPGPDFPTGAMINGRAGILEAYRTGRGRIYIRAKAHIDRDEKSQRETIVVDEIPYQLNKARLIEKIAELVRDKKLEGISELRDESDKDGLRVVIELRRGEVGEVVLNNLYAHTQLETVFGINIVGLVDGQPRVLNLKALLETFIEHRQQVITRRTVYLLRKARERGHILEGLAVALANIDPVIELIRASGTPDEARQGLLSREWPAGDVLALLEAAGTASARPDDLGPEFGLHQDRYRLSPAQAQAILDLRLHRLTGLEHDKLRDEYRDILDRIAGYEHILRDPVRLREVMREELVAIRDEYADERRTEIVESRLDLTLEDLISEEDRVVTLSHGGYVKTQPLDAYQAQRRGGRGRSATAVKDEDFVDTLLIASSHDTLLCFSSAGKVFWLKVYQIPVASRAARGRPIVNLLPLEDDERITSVLPVREFREDQYVLMATADGTIKKTALTHFSRPRNLGLRAIELEPRDRLVGTALTDGTRDVMLFSSGGKAVRFEESAVRPMGRTARGVRGIRLAEGQQVIAMLIPESGLDVLLASRNGYGKRTSVDEFPRYNRGTQGVFAMQMSERNGDLVGATQVRDDDEIMLISDQGTLVRTRADGVSQLSRITQGVRLIRLADDEHLVGLARIDESDVDDEAPEEEIE